MFHGREKNEPLQRKGEYLLGEFPGEIGRETVELEDLKFEFPSLDNLTKWQHEKAMRVFFSSGAPEEGVRFAERCTNLAQQTLITRTHLLRAEMFYHMLDEKWGRGKIFDHTQRTKWIYEEIEAAKASYKRVKRLANDIDNVWYKLTRGKPRVKRSWVPEIKKEPIVEKKTEAKDGDSIPPWPMFPPSF